MDENRNQSDGTGSNGYEEDSAFSIIDSLDDAVIIVDNGGQIIDANSHALNLWNYSDADLCKLGLKDLVIDAPLALESLGDSFRFTVPQNRGKLFESFGVKKEGAKFPVELKISKIHSSSIEDRYVCTVKDLTETNRLLDELEEAKAIAEEAKRELKEMSLHLDRTAHWAKKMAMQAQDANITKTEFLTRINHELRTPLNAISGNLELILETGLSSEQTEYVSTLQSATNKLINHIEDILDYSNIKDGKMRLDRMEFDIREEIESLSQEFAVDAQRKSLYFLSHAAPNIPFKVLGDHVRLRKILSNLVDNAIKFTEEGGIVLSVEAVLLNNTSASATPLAEYLFTVQDTGIGMTRSQMTEIFEEFYQADATTSRKYSGMGVGLTICKALVELMGGHIWASSHKGHGSQFFARLLLPVVHKDASEYRRYDLTGQKILLLEKDEAQTAVISKTLTEVGCDILHSSTNDAILSHLEEQASANALVFDAGKTDYQQVLEGARKRNILPVALCADASKIVLDGVRVVGMVDRPSRQEALLDALNARVNVVPAQPQARSAKVSKSKSTRRILLVEDNIDNQKIALKMLSRAGYEVTLAENGRDAVEAFKKNELDLILMDIYMPEMDGFGATKEIRRIEQKRGNERIPIIAFTAHVMDGYREKCLDHDMDDYLTKPVNRKSLLGMVEKWIEDSQVTVINVREMQTSTRDTMGEL